MWGRRPISCSAGWQTHRDTAAVAAGNGAGRRNRPAGGSKVEAPGNIAGTGTTQGSADGCGTPHSCNNPWRASQ